LLQKSVSLSEPSDTSESRGLAAVLAQELRAFWSI